jgi:hypothetical protein
MSTRDPSREGVIGYLRDRGILPTGDREHDHDDDCDCYACDPDAWSDDDR